MALVPYVDVDKLPQPHRRYAQEFNARYGRLPWLRLLGAHYPPFLDAISLMYPVFMIEGEIDRVTKELIFVACAATRDCQYCMGSHSRYLVQELGLTREQVILARQGEEASGLSGRQKLLIRFARKVATAAKDIGESDIEELRHAGVGDAAIVEVIAVCSFSAFANTFTDTFNMADDLEMMGMKEEYF